MTTLYNALRVEPAKFPLQLIPNAEGSIDGALLSAFEHTPVGRPNATTTAWARTRLKSVKFCRKRQKLKEWQLYQDFLVNAQDYNLPRDPAVAELDCQTPKSEADVSVAIDRQIIAPATWALLNATHATSGVPLVPQGSEFQQTRSVDIRLQVLSEAYVKGDWSERSGIRNELAAIDEDNAQGTTTRGMKSTQKAPAQQVRGIRSDKLVALTLVGELQSAGSIPRTRAVARKEKEDVHPSGPQLLQNWSTVISDSGNEFMRLDQGWGLLTDELVVELTHNKAMLCLEIKRAGILKTFAADLEWMLRTMGVNVVGNEISNARIPPSAKKRNKPKFLARIKGTQAILEQTLRYSIYYATRYVLLSDYTSNESLLLVIPDSYLTSVSSIQSMANITEEIIWIMVPRADVKLAYCCAIRDSLRQFSDLYS